MKKITTLLLCLVFLPAFSQSKSTGTITFPSVSNMTANFTLDNATSKVTLVLTGPSDRWFGLGLGEQSGFGMGSGDVLVFSTGILISDRNFVGQGTPATDVQDWTTVSNTVAGSIRTLTLTRNLTTSDTTKDFQLPYATTNSINLVCTRAGSVTTNFSNNHVYGYTSATFTNLAVEDFSLNATAIYPNPASGVFTIQTKTNLTKVKLYNQIGSLVKTIDVMNDAREITVDVKGIQSGVYFLELQNDSEKSWKKIIIN